jgi:Amt family ammonium transporter
LQSILLIIFAIGSLLLQAGFAFQASGSLRAKNSAAAVVRIVAVAAAAVLSFWAFGFALLYQHHNAWIGLDTHLLFGSAHELSELEFFYMAICMIGPAILTGVIAERSKFYVGVICSAVLAGLVFPIAGHVIWFGKLHDLGFVDIGGATVIHLSAAVFAAIGVAVVGSRAGKYNRDGSSSSIPGHSLPMLGLGVLLILAGWFPYLIGCLFAAVDNVGQVSDVSIGICAINIMLAGMGGVAGGLIYSHWRYRKPDLFFTYSGLLGGLVAISSGLYAVSSFGALITGLIAGILVPMFALILDLNARLDDPIGLIAIHGVGAIWGTLATAIFIPFERFADHFREFALQAGGIVIVMLLATLAATAVFVLLKKCNALRVTTADEFDGLDIGEHDINSYPDFQQTTIKSYHLREA